MLAGLCVLAAPGVSVVAQTSAAPKYKFDPDWPKTLPSKWRIGGVTGLAVDKDDNVWVYDRPNDLRDMELKAELTPPIADCCVRPPSMIHIDKNGSVIGSFDPPQGHGMAVDSKGFVYLGNSVRGMDTVRKYDPKSGQMLEEVPRVSEIDPSPAARVYNPGGPFAKEFRGHLTLNISNDGLVYAADRAGNRIHVTDKQGKFVKEIPVATFTAGGSAGGVMFSPDKEQRFLYVCDINNNHVWFINRQDGKTVGQLGSMGENGGQFFGLHMIATDSKGNLYTGEVFNGERVQRFVPVK